MTDKDNQNVASDDEDFVHRNWMTDRRTAGLICILPAIVMVMLSTFLTGSSPFGELIPMQVSVGTCIPGLYCDPNLELLLIGGTLLMIGGLLRLLQIAAR